MKRSNDISACIEGALRTYFNDLDGEVPAPIYDMVLKSVERPMLEVVLDHAGGNQTLASLSGAAGAMIVNGLPT